MALRDEIRLRRVATGMTQADLAIALGACASTIYNWESGKTKPNFRKIFVLSKILGVKTKKTRTVKMFSNFNCGTLNMSLKNNVALV